MRGQGAGSSGSSTTWEGDSLGRLGDTSTLPGVGMGSCPPSALCSGGGSAGHRAQCLSQ